MNLHEYQAKSLLAGMGMPCPKEIAIQQISQLADAGNILLARVKARYLKRRYMLVGAVKLAA